MRKILNGLYPFFSLLIGMTLAQILATIHVYSSNSVLYDSLVAIKNAGYLTLPNAHVMGRLHQLSPAFFGGLFFTFSIGAGISFLSLALAWIWDRLFCRKPFFLYFLLILWLACLTALNFDGFKLFVTLYFLFIPPVVFVTASKKMPDLNEQNRRPVEIFHLIPVTVLALFLAWQIDGRMFTDFRDIYLLSNPVGSRINKFYYTYTLYPAEVFKSLNQKMLKTGIIENNENTATRMLENILLNYDYIPVTAEIDADLRVAAIEDDFIFKNHDNPVLRISSKSFFADPHRAISVFEKKCDRWTLFRKITFLSLLTGFPLAIYIIAQAVFSILLGFFLNFRTASVIASALCFVLCLIFLFSFQLNRSRSVSEENLTEALDSGRWQDRVAALKLIDESALEIKQFKAYPELLKSKYIAERYWFVRTLANSRKPETYGDLLSFLSDSHPNVSSMALYALGKRGNKHAIGRIMQVIEASDDWYHQWYAYRALRALGWRQTKLN
jgi:Ca2+/Na+ antiporter